MPTKKKPVKGKAKNTKNTKKPANQTKEAEVVDVHAITYTDGITVGELADKIGKQSSEIIKTLFMEGKMVTINSALEDDDVELVCITYDIEPTKVEEREEDSLEVDAEVDPSKLEERPPVVTIMGHVDH